ncbi:MAG: glycosyl transferase family 2 [Terriglobia bacterium]
MHKETQFPPEVQQQLDRIGQTEILVGLCTHNHCRTAGTVLRTIRKGLEDHFPKYRSLVVVADGGSTDGTLPSVADCIPQDQLILFPQPLFPAVRMHVPHHGLPAKAQSLSSILEISKALDARVCLLIDADSESVKSDWVELMLHPVLEEGFDYVAPAYQRHKYDGTLTTGLLYPLTRALYGERIRQPIAQDMAISQSMAAHFLKQDVWHTQLLANCPDLWMTTVAITQGFKVCQCLLGPKLQTPRPHGGDLSHLLTQVVGGVFELMETYHSVWTRVAQSQPSPIFGLPQDFRIEPIQVNTGRMIEAFNQGIVDLTGVWEEFLSPEVLERLGHLASLPSSEFRFEDSLWVRTVFEFAVAFHNSRIDRTHILKSMTPIYLGRTASFVLEMDRSTPAEVENRIELLCLEFEELKPLLIESWKR